MREGVRSGRREGFFTTDNRFIDWYAKKVGGSGVAVYSILQRCANSKTKTTWISAGKMAKVLAIDKSTVYRKLKELEDLRLIRTLRTREKTIYHVLEVPPPLPEMGPTPLFDNIDLNSPDQDSIWPPFAPTQTGSTSESDSQQRNSPIADVQQSVAPVQPVRRAGETRNKEEQDLFNKTKEQDLFNKTFEEDRSEILKAAQRLIQILGLPNQLNAAAAAIEIKTRGAELSIDEVLREIWTEATQRSGKSRENFLADFLAQTLAERILDEINLPPAKHVVTAVIAALKAEAKDRELGLEETAALITTAAIEDRRRGIEVNRFYFENCKWRNGGRTGKGQQQFDRIKRARDEAHAIIDAQMDH